MFSVVMNLPWLVNRYQIIIQINAGNKVTASAVDSKATSERGRTNSSRFLAQRL